MIYFRLADGIDTLVEHEFFADGMLAVKNKMFIEMRSRALEDLTDKLADVLLVLLVQKIIALSHQDCQFDISYLYSGMGGTSCGYRQSHRYLLCHTYQHATYYDEA